MTGNATANYDQLNMHFFEAAQNEPIEPYRYGSFYLNKLSPSEGYEVLAFVNATSKDVSAYFFTFMLSAVLRSATGNSSFDFAVINEPFPLTAAARSSVDAGIGYITSFLFAVAFCMIPANVASMMVAERENKIKHQQIISGATMSSYWLSSFAVDILKSYITMVSAIIFYQVFDVDIPNAWILFLLFGFAIHPFTYFTTFFFTDPGEATTITRIMHILIGGLMTITVLSFYLFEETE